MLLQPQEALFLLEQVQRVLIKAPPTCIQILLKTEIFFSVYEKILCPHEHTKNG